MSEQQASEMRTKYISDADVPIVGAIAPKSRPYDKLRNIIAQIRIEIGLGVPNLKNLSDLTIEMKSERLAMNLKLTADIKENGINWRPEEDLIEFEKEFKKVTAEIVAASSEKKKQIDADPAAAVKLYGPQLEPRQYEQVTPVDSIPSKEEDQTMSAITDKDYIDARLKGMSESLDQRLETAAVKSDGRLEVIETRMDARIASMDAKLVTGMAAMDAKFDANFARFESLLHKTTADIHKATTDTLSRVIAIVSGLVGIGIAVIVLVITNLAPKPAPVAPAPVVVYAQPAPATTPAAPSVAPAAPAAK